MPAAPCVTNITHGAAFLCFDTPMKSTDRKAAMSKQVLISRRTIAEGGTVAADLKPGDKISIAGSGQRALTQIVSAIPFRSEGATMVHLELVGGFTATMPTTTEVDCEALNTDAFAERLAVTVGL